MQYYFEPQITLYKKGNVIDLSEFCFLVAVEKSIEQPAGSFRIIFNPAVSQNGKITIGTTRTTNYLEKLLEPNDIIAGKLNKRSKRHSFLGMISSINSVISKINNQTSRSIAVNGAFLLPKILNRDEVVFAPVISHLFSVQKDSALKERAEFFKWIRGLDLVKTGKHPLIGKPEDVVKYLLESLPATNTEVLDGKSVKSLFPGPRKGIKDYEGKELLSFHFLQGEYIYGDALSIFQGPVIEAIKKCIDISFYELFFDTTTGENGLPYNTLTIRTRPFSHRGLDNSKVLKGWTYWDDLPVRTINESEIFSSNIGRNDYLLKNFFRVDYTNMTLPDLMKRLGLNYPLLNFNSIKKYGVRPFDAKSTIDIIPDEIIKKHNDSISEGKPKSITSIVREDKSGYLTQLLEKRNMLPVWYGYPYYESGSLRTKLNEEITIGERINLPGKNFYAPDTEKVYRGSKYYVSAVKHSAQWGRMGESIFSLHHGQADKAVIDWFNNPENQFTEAPLEPKSAEPTMNEQPEYYEDISEAHKKILEIKELF